MHEFYSELFAVHECSAAQFSLACTSPPVPPPHITFLLSRLMTTNGKLMEFLCYIILPGRNIFFV